MKEPSEPIAKVKMSRKKRKEVKDVDGEPKKPKATWDDYRVQTFIKICLEEVGVGSVDTPILQSCVGGFLHRNV